MNMNPTISQVTYMDDHKPGLSNLVSKCTTQMCLLHLPKPTGSSSPASWGVAVQTVTTLHCGSGPQNQPGEMVRPAVVGHWRAHIQVSSPRLEV